MRERVIILYPILKERNREERMKGGEQQREGIKDRQKRGIKGKG